ncbi:hypothetical protein NDU88_004643 [Pleurodeles waltl]|uniref:Uncharacterized protein n=1 Tax=Pleurodeles waltl TaxID=8319 RepID=A0AAV7LKJ7_PLEWA|nr:hypothetical protein NDU88_004643 [Pleurodeles waltl]
MHRPAPTPGRSAPATGSAHAVAPRSHQASRSRSPPLGGGAITPPAYAVSSAARPAGPSGTHLHVMQPRNFRLIRSVRERRT